MLVFVDPSQRLNDLPLDHWSLGLLSYLPTGEELVLVPPVNPQSGKQRL